MGVGSGGGGGEAGGGGGGGGRGRVGERESEREGDYPILSLFRSWPFITFPNLHVKMSLYVPAYRMDQKYNYIFH